MLLSGIHTTEITWIPAKTMREWRVQDRFLFNDDPIAAAATEDFGRIHLFGCGGWRDEGAESGGTADVAVVITAFPK